MYVVEKFVSINGESRRAGQLAVFVRFRGCNLNCSYCDTKWANTNECPADEMSPDEIYAYIKSTKVNNVTLTGGEPLLQKDMDRLLKILSEDKSLYVEIETNGSVNIGWVKNIKNSPSLTMDFKSPSSGMCDKMLMENYGYIESKDTVKFVCGSYEDLIKAKEIIDCFDLVNKCAVYVSPVFGSIKLESIVNFMKDNNMNGVNMQLQMHKYIWSPDEKGV
ncbi:MAG: putative 7-carboxy-7-deazaguanine synthase QueE [Clostridia bacterium]|nr:putative 7-carboxy-7-deazaguanine synthase QueE [Clostridia bacterium]